MTTVTPPAPLPPEPFSAAALRPPAKPPQSAARAWWLAIRPRTLTASLAPVVVGSAVALDAGGASAAVAALCATAALALQIATNLANDVFDFLHDIDTAARIGPQRATQSGWLTPRAMLSATAAAVTIAVLCGAYLVWIGGWPILAVGLASIAAALSYSAGPFPLASHGLGELAAFLFFGVVAVCGTSYLHLGRVTDAAWVASLGVAALVANLMVVNNLRDIESDAAAGKRTLAVRIGAQATQRLYTGLLLLAYGVPLALLGLPEAGPERLLPWATLPWAWRTARAVQRASTGAEFQEALARTARLHTAYSALLALGLAG
jgi:1,4-dihydroxy-2-naphthoate octaprenyltransferase